MLFEFKIYDREIIKINKTYITNVDKYNKCKFYFDKETWQNKELFVTFINKNGYAQTVILGKWNEILSCTIPSHILNFEYFKIFCYTKDLSALSILRINTFTHYLFYHTDFEIAIFLYKFRNFVEKSRPI